jgi:hypothetical protein
MAFGLGPYGLKPFGIPPTAVTTYTIPEINSSREIDNKGRYVINEDTGEFEAMDDTHQRMVLLLAHNFVMPKIVGPDFQSTVNADVRKALRALTRPPEPVIRIKKVTADWDAGNSQFHVDFFNYKTGLNDTVTG